MSIKRLVYYNNREFAVPARKAILKACSFLGFEASELEDDVNWTCNSLVGVIHGQVNLEKDGGGFKEVEYYDELSQETVTSANRLAVIFISSERAPEEKRAAQVRFRQSEGKECVRYLLPIRRTIESGLTTKTIESEPDEETVNRWISLLEAVTTPGVLEGWFKSPASPGGNSILNEMLLEPTSTESLIALSVLCQGYLAVLALNEKGAPQSREVADALRDSGVESVVGPPLVLPPLATVANPTWWQEVFSIGKQEFERGVAREWGIIDFQECPKPLKDLIGAIYSAGSRISAQVVAEGYLAIAKRLRTA